MKVLRVSDEAHQKLRLWAAVRPGLTISMAAEQAISLLAGSGEVLATTRSRWTKDAPAPVAEAASPIRKGAAEKKSSEEGEARPPWEADAPGLVSFQYGPNDSQTVPLKLGPQYVKDPSFDDGEAPAGESQVRGGRRKGK